MTARIATIAPLASLVMILSSPALAQDQNPQPKRPADRGGVAATGAAGIPVGPLTVYPGVDVSVGYDDNLLRSSVNRVTTPVTVIAPYLTIEGRRGPHTFDIRYRGGIGIFTDSRQDNYTDTALQANAKLLFTARSDLTARFDQKYGHDPRGSTDRPLSENPDRYRETGAFALLGYGAQGAKGRIELDGEYYERRYTNNLQYTAISDVDRADAGLTFFWRIAPKTRLLMQGRYKSFNYIDPASTLDSEELRFYAGGQWEATAKTTGFAKIGYMRKNFETPGLQDISTNSWDAGIRWSPRTYSVFDFTALRGFNESTGIGDTIVQSRAGVRWTHAWNSRLSHSIGYDFINDKYKGNTDRDDNTNAIGLRVDYRMRRWLKFGAEYLYTDRDSNEPQYRYRRNVIMFSVGATL